MVVDGLLGLLHIFLIETKKGGKNMKRKIVGIVMAMLMMAAAVAPVIGSSGVDKNTDLGCIVKLGNSGKRNIPTANLDPGDVVLSFDSPREIPYGLAWDGQYIWNVDYGPDYIYKLNSCSGEVVDTITTLPPACNSPTGLAWDGTYLWVADWGDDDRTYKVNPDSGSIVDSFLNPSVWAGGLAWDDDSSNGPYLWYAVPNDNQIYQCKPNYGSDTLDIVETFTHIGNKPEGLAWDGQYLWVADSAEQKIYQCEPNYAGSTPTFDFITSFGSPESSPTGLAWDGQFLWNADDHYDKIYKIEVHGGGGCHDLTVGECDNFQLPTEPTCPSQTLLDWINVNYAGADGSQDCDEDPEDQYWAHTFDLTGLCPDCCIKEATLEITVRNDDENDHLKVGCITDGSDTWEHNERLEKLNIPVGDTGTVTLDLSTISGLLDCMETNCWLDVAVDDDSPVDCAILSICCCECCLETVGVWEEFTQSGPNWVLPNRERSVRWKVKNTGDATCECRWEITYPDNHVSQDQPGGRSGTHIIAPNHETEYGAYPIKVEAFNVVYGPFGLWPTDWDCPTARLEINCDNTQCTNPLVEEIALSCSAHLIFAPEKLFGPP